MKSTQNLRHVLRHVLRHFALVTLLLASSLGSAQAVTLTFYGTRAAFDTAVAATGQTTLTQTFAGYAAGTNLAGVQVLPNVTLSTNLASMAVADIAGLGKVAFATPRNQPEVFYNVNFTGSTRAFGFDIVGFDPATTGPGFLSFYFTDGDITYTQIPILPGATATTPLFLGLMADKNLTKMTWSEGPLLNFSCCEDTGLDNLVVAVPVPEPGTGLLLTGGIAAAAWVMRRRRDAR